MLFSSVVFFLVPHYWRLIFRRQAEEVFKGEPVDQSAVARQEKLSLTSSVNNEKDKIRPVFVLTQKTKEGKNMARVDVFFEEN